MTNADDEIEKMSQTILLELETATSKDLSTAHYAKKMLQLSDLDYTKGVLLEIQNASSGDKSDIEKKSSYKSTAIYYVAAETLFHNKNRYNGSHKHVYHAPRCVIFWHDKRLWGNYPGRVHIRVFAGYNEII